MTLPPSASSIPALADLTVLRALIERLPHARFAFLGDTARLPYGSKSRRTIARYAAQSAQFLVREQGAEFLVIACNTASALALDAIQDAVPVPVLGVIEPGAAAARAASKTGDVLVIATEATVHSHAYAAACQARGLRALEKACPLLVPLVEEGWTDHPVTAEVIDIYLNELRAEAAAQGISPDTLVLGCTHYPLLRPLIERAVRPGVQGHRFRRIGGAGRGRALQRPRVLRSPPAGSEASEAAARTSNRDALLRHRFRGEIRAARLAVSRAARGHVELIDLGG